MPSDKAVEIFLTDVEPFFHEHFDWHDYRVGYFVAKNKSKSTNNEDTLFIRGEGKNLVFGVADGAGGHSKGREAAYLAGKIILDAYKQANAFELSTVQLIERVNEKIKEMRVGAHSTVAFATLQDQDLRCYSVGDSEILHWNANASLSYSSIPHTEVGYQIEAGVLKQKDSLDDPDRHLVDNLLGDPSIRIEASSKIQIKKGHSVLIGTDGLFDNISHGELEELLAKGAFEQSFESLVKKCLNSSEASWKKDDDISFVFLRRVKA